MPKNQKLSTVHFPLSTFLRTFACILCAFMKIILVIAFVAAAILLLCVGVIFRKDHSFRSQHIHQNDRMKQDNIHCSTAQDREMRREKKNKIETKNL